MFVWGSPIADPGKATVKIEVLGFADVNGVTGCIGTEAEGEFQFGVGTAGVNLAGLFNMDFKKISDCLVVSISIDKLKAYFCCAITEWKTCNSIYK